MEKEIFTIQSFCWDKTLWVKSFLHVKRNATGTLYPKRKKTKHRQSGNTMFFTKTFFNMLKIVKKHSKHPSKVHKTWWQCPSSFYIPCCYTSLKTIFFEFWTMNHGPNFTPFHFSLHFECIFKILNIFLNELHSEPFRRAADSVKMGSTIYVSLRILQKFLNS